MKRGSDSPPPEQENQFEQRLAHDYFVRFHMSLILAAVTASGVLTSKGLLELGVHSLRLRYPVAVMTSYLVFLLLVRLWIWYVTLRTRSLSSRSAFQGGSNRGGIGSLNIGGGSGGASLDTGGGSGGFSGFRGGSSGGGGASDSWDTNIPAAIVAQPSPAPGGSGGSSVGSWFGDLNFDLDGDGWAVILLLAALLLAIIFAGGYLIYAAPQILPEAAWQAVLTTSLTRISKEEHHDWMSGVIKSTAIPFSVVLLLASALGWFASRACPAAPRLVDVLRCILQ
jgi:hypothetical protein